MSLRVLLRWCYTGQLAMIRCCAKNHSSVTPRSGWFLRFCSSATPWKFLKLIQTCNMSANSCEKRALRIGVTSWRCKLTSVTSPLHVWNIRCNEAKYRIEITLEICPILVWIRLWFAKGKEFFLGEEKWLPNLSAVPASAWLFSSFIALLKYIFFLFRIFRDNSQASIWNATDSFHWNEELTNESIYRILNKQWAKEVGKILESASYSLSSFIPPKSWHRLKNMLLVYCQVILVLVISVLPRGRKDRWRFFLICRKRKKIKLKKRYEDSIVKCHQHTKEASNQDQGLTAQLAKTTTTTNKRKKEMSKPNVINPAPRDRVGNAIPLYTLVCYTSISITGWIDLFRQGILLNTFAAVHIVTQQNCCSYERI